MTIRILSRCFDLILDSCAFVAGFLLLMVTLFVSYSCIARYLNFNPPVWVLQFTEYALLWVTFFGAGWLLREGGHIRVDTVISHAGRRTRFLVDLLDDFLGFGISLVLFAMGTINTMDLYERQIMDFNAVILHKYYVFWVIPFGALLLVVQFLRSILQQLKRGPLQSAPSVEEAISE
jgi:C4-dicarboxylate transporter DctQ subunit